MIRFKRFEIFVVGDDINKFCRTFEIVMPDSDHFVNNK